MLVTLPLVQMNQAPREVNQQIKDVRTNQAQIMIKSWQFLKLLKTYHF